MISETLAGSVGSRTEIRFTSLSTENPRLIPSVGVVAVPVVVMRSILIPRNVWGNFQRFSTLKQLVRRPTGVFEGHVSEI